MLIDLHCHTKPKSWDSRIDVDFLIEETKKAGIDGVCLSEHDRFWTHEETSQLSKRHDFLVLPAVEMSTQEGHFLCYGIDAYMYGMHEGPELARRVQEANGVMVAAHPSRRQMSWQPAGQPEYDEALKIASRNPMYASCVALEALNGRGGANENAFSTRLCKVTGLPGTAGTDSHDKWDIGKCATEFDKRIETLEDLITELCSGRFRPVALNMR